jgi:hypothetical protein
MLIGETDIEPWTISEDGLPQLMTVEQEPVASRRCMTFDVELSFRRERKRVQLAQDFDMNI